MVVNILRVSSFILVPILFNFGVLLGLLLAVFKTVHWYSVWLALTCVVGLAVSGVLLNMLLLRPYGLMKPGDWLKKNGDDVDALLDALLEPTVGSADPGKQQNYSSLESGCDASIESFGAILGYDSVVMTTESNTAFVFNVEIVDLTRLSLNSLGGVNGFDVHGICMTAANAPPAGDCPFPHSRTDKFQARGGMRWQDGLSSTNAFRRFPWQVDAAKIPNLTYDNMNVTSALKGYLNDLSTNYGGQACDCTECAKNCLSCVGSNSNLMCQDSGQTPCAPGSAF